MFNKKPRRHFRQKKGESSDEAEQKNGEGEDIGKTQVTADSIKPFKSSQNKSDSSGAEDVVEDHRIARSRLLDRLTAKRTRMDEIKLTCSAFLTTKDRSQQYVKHLPGFCFHLPCSIVQVEERTLTRMRVQTEEIVR